MKWPQEGWEDLSARGLWYQPWTIWSPTSSDQSSDYELFQCLAAISGGTNPIVLHSTLPGEPQPYVKITSAALKVSSIPGVFMKYSE